ncbi:peptidase inhibitor family I36 protein [Streptomyces venetus]|uniref:peptidase inhibitor family I36 protein n=1 Tax=Streptomyces venetus TaxID=1701086 RepID=UPI0031EC1ED8
MRTGRTVPLPVQLQARGVLDLQLPGQVLGHLRFGGQPWVRRAVNSSVEDLPSAIRDRGSSIRNNSDRTARVYEKRNHSGRHVCITRSGGSIHDLRGYNLNDQTRSLKINRNNCG